MESLSTTSEKENVGAICPRADVDRISPPADAVWGVRRATGDLGRLNSLLSWVYTHYYKISHLPAMSDFLHPLSCCRTSMGLFSSVDMLNTNSRWICNRRTRYMSRGLGAPQEHETSKICNKNDYKDMYNDHKYMYQMTYT